MIQERLNDAAIKLHRLLDEVHVQHGIFGGYAIGVLGGNRASKDVDCIASASKESLIAFIDGKQGFQRIPQNRPDYVAFLWSDHSDRRDAVLVELFAEQFEGARYGMSGLSTHKVAVSGQASGSGRISLLDPVQIFKGKLHAAATRAKFHDSADLRWLAVRAKDKLIAARAQLNLPTIGLALKRYPELKSTFLSLEINTKKAEEAVANVSLSQLPPPKVGDVQMGLLA